MTIKCNGFEFYVSEDALLTLLVWMGINKELAAFLWITFLLFLFFCVYKVWMGTKSTVARQWNRVQGFISHIRRNDQASHDEEGNDL